MEPVTIQKPQIPQESNQIQPTTHQIHLESKKSNLSLTGFLILFLFSLSLLLFVILPLFYSFTTFTNPKYNSYEDFGPLFMIAAVIFANIFVFPITNFLLLRFKENLHGKKLVSHFVVLEIIFIAIGIFTIASPFILLGYYPR